MTEINSEINLIDMLFMLCGHWKSIACAMLAGAVLVAGIGTLKWRQQEKSEMVGAENVQSENTESGEMTEEAERLRKEALISSYQNRIAAGWEQYETLNTYLENSPLQRLDAENVYQQVSLYEITVEESEQAMHRMALLQEAYQDMASDETLYRAVGDSLGLDIAPQFLGELIGIEQKLIEEPLTYTGMEDNGYLMQDRASGVMTVRVLGSTSWECTRISRAIDAELQKYYQVLRGRVGEHSVEKLMLSECKIRKPDIIQKKADMRNQMMEQLKTIDDLEKKITALEEELKKDTELSIGRKIQESVILSLVLGMLFGGACVCVYWSIHYLFDGKMHNADLLSHLSGRTGYGLRTFTDKKMNRLEKLRLGGVSLPIREVGELAALAETELALALERQLPEAEAQQVPGKQLLERNTRLTNERCFALISSQKLPEYEAFAKKLSESAKKQDITLLLFAGDAHSAECLDVIAKADSIIWIEKKDASAEEQARKIRELCCLHQTSVLMNVCVL